MDKLTITLGRSAAMQLLGTYHRTCGYLSAVTNGAVKDAWLDMPLAVDFFNALNDFLCSDGSGEIKICLGDAKRE